MANNGARIPVPRITDLSSEELQSWQAVADHPLLDGQLIEDITLSTTTKYTRVPHALGRPYRGFIDVRGVGLTEDQANPNKDKEIWLYQEAAPVLLDYQAVTDTTSTDVTFSSLSGNLDDVYRLDFHIVRTTTSAQDFTLKINGSTGSDSQLLHSNQSTTTSSDRAGTLLAVSNDNVFGSVYFSPKTGRRRLYTSVTATDTNIAVGVLAGVLANTSTAITSLGISNSSAQLTAGSEFWLYSMGSRATKASIWIF